MKEGKIEKRERERERLGNENYFSELLGEYMLLKIVIC